MLVPENNVLEQEEISSSSNSENEFKELDNEIEKVVRGEASYEDETQEKKDLNATSSTSQNSSKNNQKIINKKGNNPKEENKVNKIKNTKASNISINDFKSLNNKDKSSINHMIYTDKNIPNKIANFQKKYENNHNQFKTNFTNNLNLLNNIYKNNSSFNPNQFNINCNNNFSTNINNKILNELICINNNIPKNGINYSVNINNMKEYEFINNICKQINNNLNPLNNNVNNDQLISSIANLLYSNNINQESLPNNMCNNLIINNNQMINPINFNLNFSNNNNIDNLNSNNNQFCLRNKLNNNGFNNNIYNSLSHYLQINNTHNINSNINNIIKENNENILNKLENSLNNNYNFIDRFVNNLVNNNNQILNNININTNYNNNFDNGINDNNIKQINNENYKHEKKGKNSNKRKIFYPLSDSEKEKNIINLMDIFQCKDLRTTLMIKNIPNKYTISSFLEEINEYFKNTYDIFYLPIDYINKCNLGFAFIDFVEPFHIILFYEMYRGKKWKKFNSDKVCELLFAKFQGRRQLISHFEKGKVLSFESEDKRPLILPFPRILPDINLPLKYLDLFQKSYPYIYYKIKNINNNKNNSVLKVFSINGNFYKK